MKREIKQSLKQIGLFALAGTMCLIANGITQIAFTDVTGLPLAFISWFMACMLICVASDEIKV